MSSDAVRFLYETASFKEVLMTMLRISFLHTMGCGVYFAASLLINRDYLKQFYNRRKLVKKGA